MTHWTTDSIPDQEGKVFIITGANSGLGYESARALAKKGAKIILACRNLEKGESARQKIRKETPGADLDLKELDLANLVSVAGFASEVRTKHKKLDVLMNNAGIMATPYGKTLDGFEQQLGINHLGHFALTGRLLGLLLKTPGSRIVNVSSKAARRGIIHFDDLMGENKYIPWERYGQSKLANLLFTFELHRRLQKHNLNLKVIAAHPGVSVTNLHQAMAMPGVLKTIYEKIFSVFLPDAARGALSQLYAATASEAQSGAYYGPGGWSEMAGYPSEARVPAQALNAKTAVRLWDISEELTGVKFRFEV
jgi:NAD(P)-dependent dehydrogenase (short-subunit alcohol dehydrogenase family)